MSTESPPEQSQLDRIEARLNLVVTDVTMLLTRVTRVEGKASFWGAMGAVGIAVVSKLAGCV